MKDNFGSTRFPPKKVFVDIKTMPNDGKSNWNIRIHANQK